MPASVGWSEIRETLLHYGKARLKSNRSHQYNNSGDQIINRRKEIRKF